MNVIDKDGCCSNLLGISSEGEVVKYNVSSVYVRTGRALGGPIAHANKGNGCFLD